MSLSDRQYMENAKYGALYEQGSAQEILQHVERLEALIKASDVSMEEFKPVFDRLNSLANTFAMVQGPKIKARERGMGR